MGLGWVCWRPTCDARQAWYLVASTCVLRGRRGTRRHRPAFCVAGAALVGLSWLWSPVTHNSVTHHLSTQLCHRPSCTHTQLCHTPSVTHNFVTHHPSHFCHTPSLAHLCYTPSLPHTLFHTRTHNFVTRNIVIHHLSHNFVTYYLPHTTLSHTTLHI